MTIEDFNKLNFKPGDYGYVRSGSFTCFFEFTEVRESYGLLTLYAKRYKAEKDEHNRFSPVGLVHISSVHNIHKITEQQYINNDKTKPSMKSEPLYKNHIEWFKSGTVAIKNLKDPNASEKQIKVFLNILKEYPGLEDIGIYSRLTHTDYPSFLFDGKQLSGIGDSVSCQFDNAEDFWLAPIPKGTVEVRLNKEYTAIISEDGVKAGCQKFTHESILNLAEKIKEFKNGD